jgi:hypothetical protein
MHAPVISISTGYMDYIWARLRLDNNPSSRLDNNPNFPDEGRRSAAAGQVHDVDHLIPQ